MLSEGTPMGLKPKEMIKNFFINMAFDGIAKAIKNRFN